MGEKPFKSYEGQIEKLENEKKLIITDRKHAIDCLKEISYFALISGYKKLFKNPENKLYYRGVQFEDIESLYQFDANLRTIILKYLLEFEQHFKSLYSYFFTERYGDIMVEYLNANNYCYNASNMQKINDMIGILTERSSNRPVHKYIEHYINKHTNVPLWVLVNALTLGNMSVMYQVSKQDIRDKVSREFPPLNSGDMARIVSFLSKFRNVCAHNEPLFCHYTREAIPQLPIHAALKIPKNGSAYICGQRDIFAVILSLKYLLKVTSYKELYGDLQAEINALFEEDRWLKKEKLLETMGFPENWEEAFRQE